jgi:hypothetical protein
MYEAVADDAAEQQERAKPQRVRLGDHRDAEVGRQADHQHVQHGADPWPLPQGDPQQQHDGARGDDDLAERETDVTGDALVEDVPRIEAQGRLDQHRHREAVQEQADVQLDEPDRQSAARHRPSTRSTRVPRSASWLRGGARVP